MTQDEILKMADECGLAGYFELDGDSVGQLMVTAFAKLVAEKEREACALICDEFPDVGLIGKKITSDYHAYLIRARGKA